jgi:hypothetical protein
MKRDESGSASVARGRCFSATLIVALVVLGSAACSSNSSTSTSSPSGGSQAGANSSSPISGASAGTATHAAVLIPGDTLITAADVAAILGPGAALQDPCSNQTYPANQGGGTKSSCRYVPASGPGGFIDLQVSDGLDVAGRQGFEQQHGGPAGGTAQGVAYTAVSGIGDSAYTWNNGGPGTFGGSIQFLKGTVDVSIVVAVTASVDPAAIQQLAKTAASRV